MRIAARGEQVNERHTACRPMLALILRNNAQIDHSMEQPANKLLCRAPSELFLLTAPLGNLSYCLYLYKSFALPSSYRGQPQ